MKSGASDPVAKGVPFRTGFTVIHKDSGTGLMPVIEAVHGPIVVRDDLTHPEPESAADVCDEFGGSVEGALLAITLTELAYLNAEAGGVARTIVIGVFTSLIEGHVLDDFAVVHSKMPDVKTTLVPLSLRTDAAFAEEARVGRSRPAWAAGAVDGDESRAEWDVDLTPKLPVWDEILMNRITTAER